MLFLLCYFPVFGILIYVLVLPLQHSLVLPSPPMLCKIVRALECGVVAQHSDCFCNVKLGMLVAVVVTGYGLCAAVLHVSA